MTLGKDRIVAALGCVLLLLASWPAIAQVVLPGTADPLRLQEQRRPTPSPRPSGPAMQLEEEAPPAPPAGAEDIRFTLTRLVVEGATAYPIAALQPAWQDLIGREISLLDLYGVATKITRQYRNDGYVLSRALVRHSGSRAASCAWT